MRSLSSIIKLSKHQVEPVDNEVFILDIHSLNGDEPEPEGFCDDTEYQNEPVQEEIDPREEAERVAAEIIAAAHAQADRIRSQAYEEGYAEGRSVGESQLLGAIENTAKLAEDLNAKCDEFIASLEPQVVKLSVEIAEKIIRHEITMKPDAVMDTVKAGLRQLRDKESVKLRVNPSDVEFVKQKRPDIIAMFDGIQNLEIVDDRRVDRGGCMIDAPGGVLDARMRTQMREVERVLTEAAAENAGSGDAGSE